MFFGSQVLVTQVAKSFRSMAIRRTQLPSKEKHLRRPRKFHASRRIHSKSMMPCTLDSSIIRNCWRLSGSFEASRSRSTQKTCSFRRCDMRSGSKMPCWGACKMRTGPDHGVCSKSTTPSSRCFLRRRCLPWLPSSLARERPIGRRKMWSVRQGEPDGGKALPSSENLLKASPAAADLAERSQKAEPRELARRDPSPRRYLEAYARKATPPLEDPAVISRIDALQAEATVLREELRQADLQIQTAASESAAANADLRESRLRHQQWLRSMQEESGRLRRENKRLDQHSDRVPAGDR
eukprot:g13092.t2